MLIHMTTIPFPVLFECRNVLKRTKTTKIKSKDDKIIRLFDFDFMTNQEVGSASYLNKDQ